jgi:hypothetical protein
LGTKIVTSQSAKPLISQRQVDGRKRSFAVMGSLVVLLSLTATGCQMDIAGQTLPSPYYLTDDVQYYAPGPEFKLAREAAVLKEQAAEQISEPQR